MSDDATVLRARSRTNSRSGPAPAGEPAPTPRVLKSRFVLDEKLGSGGMGTVYRAKDLRKVEARDRFPYVAIKVLNSDVREHPEAYIALEREAAKSQQLSHPNIVSIFDFDKDGDVPFITMELLQGRELADLLHAYPNGLPEPLGWDVIRGLCAGLRYAHDNGVVHADFKPGNVYVTAQDVAKILDFGIARAVQVRPDLGEDTVFDPARMAAITPVYASLEMIRGDNPEARDDIYALGVVIYMILTGHHPYGRLPADEAMAEGLEPERPQNLSRSGWRMLSQMLSFYRQGRPGSVAEVEQVFFGQSPWRSRALAAAGLTLALFAGSFAVIEGAQIDEVKEEVRQTTLLDAQAARVSGYLLEGASSLAAMTALNEELRRLARLDPEGTYLPELEHQFRQRLLEAARSAERWEDVVAFFQLLRDRGVANANGLLVASAHRFFDEMAAPLLQRPRPDEASAAAVLSALLDLDGSLRTLAPEHSLAPRLEALGAQLGDQALSLAEAGALKAANEVLALAEALAPQSERLQTLHAIAEAEDARARAEQRQRRIDQELRAAQASLGGSCLRLQVDGTSVPKTATARRYIDGRLAECLVDLRRVDSDRARDLQRQAQARFGSLPKVAAVNLDPCLAQGVQLCTDRLPGGAGPDLVVVALEDALPAFAMSHEVTGAQFAEFCAAVGEDCGELPAHLPVTDVPAALMERYAAWLSEQTGYAYRLPHIDEWLAVSSAQPTGTVNCGGGFLKGRRLQRSDAGQANAFGLHHLLGNAAELVRVEGGYEAVGGSIDDNGHCSTDLRVPVNGQAPGNVGFRLVRELS